MKKNILKKLIISLCLFTFINITNIFAESFIDLSNAIEVVKGNNKFCFELYLNLNNEDSGNLFFSPYSISTALSITYEGAKGQTAEEIQSVFNFPTDNIIRRSGFLRIYNIINKNDKDYELSTANALWAQQNYDFLGNYFQLIKNYYCGLVTNLDFYNEAEKSRHTINNWVEEQTNNKIKDLISEGQITPLTTLVITNAIYFKGTWKYQFNKDNTREMDFRISSENISKTAMMYLKNEDVKFNYFETENLQMLEMPYDGEEISMLIVLPKDNLNSIKDELNYENFNALRTNMQEEEVVIYLPKFSLDTKYLLKDCLSDMGMPLAFTEAADFSGMTGLKDLYISLVIHQAYVEVNEEGTEAAAATAVVMERTTGVPTTKTFLADHPFIFLIMDKQTGNILFMGRVVDPTI